MTGSGWILDAYLPGSMSGLARAAVHFGVLGVVFLALSTLLRRGERLSLRRWVQVALLGAALFGVPPVMFEASGGKVARLTEVLVFALTPAMVVWMEAQRASPFGLYESGLRRMVPALAGFAGLALLLPMTLPSSGAGMAWLAGDGIAALLAGAAIVRWHRLLAGGELSDRARVLRIATAVCVGSAVVCALFSGPGGSAGVEISGIGMAQEALRCVVLDGPVVLLSVWLLGRLKPGVFAAQYLIVPLITVVEGYLWLRPATHWPMIAGAILTAGGSGVLLMSDEAAPLTD